MEDENIVEFEELDKQFLEEVEAKRKALKEKHPKNKLFTIVVEGDVDSGEKPYYVGFFKRPSMVAFSKYLALAQNNQVPSMKALAKDCFVDGDRELVDDDDLFMFGMMPQLVKVIEARKGRLVNFTNPGK